MPRINRPAAMPSPRLAVRPSGEASSDPIAELRIVAAPTRTQVYVDGSPTPTPAQMPLVGDLYGGVRYLIQSGRRNVRAISPSGEAREWTGVLPRPSIDNIVRILNFLGIATGSSADEARGKLRDGLRQGWAESDLADARLLLAVLTTGPYADSDSSAASVIPPLATLAKTASETRVYWQEMQVLAPPSAAHQPTESTTAPPAHRAVPRTDGVGSTGSFGTDESGPDGAPPPAPQPSTVSIVGMPPGGVAHVDDVVVSNAVALPLSRVENGEIIWVVPATPGRRVIRVDPPVGGGGVKRTQSVDVPPHGTTYIRYSGMTASTAGVTPPPPPAPTLRINGMPDGGAVYIDGVRTDDSRSRWSSTGGGWIVPARAGSHVVRVVTREGVGRTATVSIPPTGEASVAYPAGMAPETPDAPPPPPPPPTILVIAGMPNGGTISVNDRALDMSTGQWSGNGAWAIIAPSGQSSVVVTPPPSMNAPARRADVMIAQSSTTTLNFPTMAAVPGTGPAQEPEKRDDATPPPHGTEEPQKHDETPPPADHSHDEDEKRRAEPEETKRRADADHPTEHPIDTVTDGTVVSTGRVVVRTTLPNVAGMVQRVDGSAVAHGAMDRAADGMLTASVAPGSYQLVVWQGAEFPSLTRSNVRMAGVNVLVGADSVFTYTGAALTPEGTMRSTGVGGDRVSALLAAGGSADLVLLHYGDLVAR